MKVVIGQGSESVSRDSEPVLRVYSRLGCHLCEDMLYDLKQFETELAYRFEVYDVDDDEMLFEQFNALVPIVFLGEQEIFRYFFEYASLKNALSGVE